MNIVENEYVHEYHRANLDDTLGRILSVYEPPDYQPISVAGTIYLNDKEVYPFMGMGGPLVFCGRVPKKGPKIISGNLQIATGVISIVWDSDPGDHFLCLSYEFSELPRDEEETQKINWRKEGF